ncbi:hypothetical protein OLX02_15355 [Novosphingobium sp. KCTC 2891]|uniref:hypothetical protein n=1 Tax=Novosphingobium sp. KCTC 2891 TaxID=2989730 RepID=UPI002222235C|nr:hypothetical protein [Novosphingobium sp. KCTC 2891]MCW1384200.1 hypothetical protein [Novosphingobium sp. KCTC 2891]
MRRAEALLLAAALAGLLAGCSRGGEDALPQRKIDCALGGANAFAPDCAVEEAVQRGRALLIVFDKAGGFRRFEKVADGRGVISADGVEETTVQWIPDGRLEVTVGQDRYRFPAKVKPEPDAPKP